MPRLFPRRAHEPSVALSCRVDGRSAWRFRMPLAMVVLVSKLRARAAGA